MKTTPVKRARPRATTRTAARRLRKRATRRRRRPEEAERELPIKVGSRTAIR